MDVLKKERIKDRMLKTASKIWGIPESELEANYDPLVFLLIEACAAEFEKIGYDIQASQNRLLDKLADMMLPEILSGAKPPACVMQAKPVDTQTTIDSSTRFSCEQRIATSKKNTNVEIHFTPIGKFPLLNASLKKVLIGDKLYGIRENGTKEVIFEKNTDDSKPVFELGFAIEADNALKSLQHLSLFFDLRKHSEAHSFYKNLEHVTAFVNNEPLQVRSGYALHEQFDFNPAMVHSEGNDYSSKIHMQVAGSYKIQFLHIADTRSLSTMMASAPPDSWQHILPEDVVKKEFAIPMIYLKLKLSRPYPRYVLESLMFGINSFPVVCRKLNSLNYRTNAWINIIPLQIDGSFIDLHSISSSTGKYKIRNAPNTHGLEEGDASVRSGGMGKPGSRDVRDHVNSLMQAIRDESAYFSDISNDAITNRLREINQILIRLQDQLNASRDRQDQYSYVLLNPKKAGESVNIQYWTSHVPAAKQVKAYTQVNCLEHISVDPKTTYILTSVVGGKNGVSEAEKATYLKQQISSRGKIVSAEDVKLLAVQLFGSNLQKVTVQKTIEAGTGNNQGFVRKIKVTLHLHGNNEENHMNEMQFLAQEMEYTLSENASPVYPYEVILV